MPLNFDLAGKTYEPVSVTVTADQIAEYAAASGDANPAHVRGDDQVASAVFAVVPAFGLMGATILDPELGVDNPLMIVHGEQHFDYYRPIHPGDELTLTASLESVEDKGSGAAFVTKVALAGAEEKVVDVFATIFVRGAGSGTRTARRTGRDAPQGGEVCRFTRRVADDMPARYAAASGDHNPIHLDDSVAKAVGLPGVITHGLGSLSLVAGGLVLQLAGGDVTRLRSLGCRFTSPVLPGEDLTTRVFAGGEGSYTWSATRPSGVTALRGTLQTVTG